MEWLVYLKVIFKAPNYYHDQNVICTYKEIFNQTQGRNKAFMIIFMTMLNNNHGEPDQEFKSWHGINGIAEFAIPKTFIVHASEYENIFICPLVTGRLYQHKLTMDDQNWKLLPVNSGRLNKIFRAGSIFTNQMINQCEASVHIGLSVYSKRFMCEGN
jgi:hypothetical protein